MYCSSLWKSDPLQISLSLDSRMLHEGVHDAGKSGEGGHEMKDRERDQEANVVDTAVQVLGVVAQQLEWPRYQELLGIFNRAMQRTEGKVCISP